jgi:hypothetical protein
VGVIQRRLGGGLRRPNGEGGHVVVAVPFSCIVRGKLADDGRTPLVFCQTFISYSLYKLKWGLLPGNSVSSMRKASLPTSDQSQPHSMRNPIWGVEVITNGSTPFDSQFALAARCVRRLVAPIAQPLAS